ncbi:hypothetical protein [Streptomyces albidoflavus]|uniref:hypothetical protein n=1 Tax=Streptomyces albidoflavus TaxID=1886 RepID=UPI00340AC453
MSDWPALVAEMQAVKNRLAVSDREGIWRHEPPRPPARPASIAEISAVTQCPLDVEYADFLLHADGWPAILQDIDLFGSVDFGTSAYAQAEELVRVIEAEVDIGRGPCEGRLIPVGASRTDIDIFVVPCRMDSPSPSPVIWLAGGEIERYRSFSDFFRGMISENRSEADALA